MTVRSDHPDDRSFDDPTLARLHAQLDARARRLGHRPGLSDRVMAAIERELDAPMVLARIGPATRRRWMSMAAALMLMVGGLVVGMLLLRGERASNRGSFAGDALVLAEASRAERMLVAFGDEPVPGAAGVRRELIEEILPGAAVQYDELDLELQRILSAAGANGASSR